MSKIIGNTTATPNPRPDWNQTDENKADYIKNKPEVLTEEDVTRLISENGGGTGVVVNQVQSDWNQTDDTAVDYIKNKPDIISQEELHSAVDDALILAKESGEFNGANGTSVTHSWNGTVLTLTSSSGTDSVDLKGDKGDAPVKGVDYWTESDISDIKAYVDEAILGGSW